MFVPCSVVLTVYIRWWRNVINTARYHSTELVITSHSLCISCRRIHHRRHRVLLARRGQCCDRSGQTGTATILHRAAASCVQRSEVHNRWAAQYSTRIIGKKFPKRTLKDVPNVPLGMYSWTRQKFYKGVARLDPVAVLGCRFKVVWNTHPHQKIQ